MLGFLFIIMRRDGIVMQSREIFSRRKIDNKEISSALAFVYDIDNKEVLFIEMIDDWLKAGEYEFIIEYNGQICNEDDEYPEYHYYDIWYKKKKYQTKLHELKNQLGKEVIVTVD